MRKSFFVLSFVLILVSCGKNNKFTIEGNVKNAYESMLYLEHVDVSKVTPVDSVKLSVKGNFKFTGKRPESPHFYRLRLNKQLIDLAVDSTETIRIQADSSSFAKDYTVEGSENCVKVKEFSILRNSTANKLNELNKTFITEEQYLEQMYRTIDVYKEAARKEIIGDPSSTVAYYALLQTINGLVIFDPYDKADNRLYGAVATQWDFRYPNSLLGKQVKNLALQGIKVMRAERPLEYKEDKIINVFDIDLPDISGKKLKLSQVAQKKITLLEFCTYLEQGSPEHNMLLAKVYEKYKDKGFQIYQVSIDPDEHAWKNAVFNLPWICVRDPQSVYSELLKQYNVRALPTGFIIDKEGEIVFRVTSYKDLEEDIAKKVISYF